jgi:malonate-semialdehyde dehydrogenase (acetylating) / methylmalonate-semialdehyde dehydrogenase
MTKIENFIDGKIQKSNSSSFIDVLDPSKGEVINSVCNSNELDCQQALESSQRGFLEWSKFTPLKRSRVMSEYKQLISRDIKKLAEIVSVEHGKTLDDAIGSITRGLEVVEFSCGIPHLLKGEFSSNVGTDIDSWSTRQPLGICAGITPFNFPAMVPMWMYPMAIACGNSFILKPSEKNPSCALELARLFTEAGLPDGVLNILNGDKNVVNFLIKNENISSLSFVGSTPVAKYIYSESAKYGKRVQALGGAKNHLVVMPDANKQTAVDGVIGAAYGASGERCMAVSVAVAVGDIADELVENIKIKAEQLKVAPWTNDESEMGPLISLEHKEKVINYITQGENEGADLLIDGRNINIQGYEKGFFVGPTLFDKVKSNMSIYKEEIFGPVLSIVRVNTYEEALNLVNTHQYGNGTSIYTSDGEISRHFTTNCKIGMVGVNVPIPVPMAFHSFGGWKQSLFGGHAMHGDEGVRFYTKLKTVTSRWPNSIKSGPEFILPTN